MSNDSARERDSGGRYSQEITDEDVLATLDEGAESASVVVLSSQQVADRLGMSRVGAHKRLSRLADENKIIKHNLGPNSVAWTRARALRPVGGSV